MMRWVVLWLVVAGSELITNRHRAVTLEPGERKSFRVPDVETFTGGTGRCIEESVDSDEADSISLTAVCSGLRTTLAWKKGGTRVHIMACAEGDERPAALLSLRKTLQAELRLRSVTACVRNNRVELWGWAEANDLPRFQAMEKKYGRDKVRSYVELLESTD